MTESKMELASDRLQLIRRLVGQRTVILIPGWEGLTDADSHANRGPHGSEAMHETDAS